MAPVPISGELAGIYEAFFEGLSQVLDPTKIQVVAGLFPGEQGMYSMVKVITPLGI